MSKRQSVSENLRPRCLTAPMSAAGTHDIFSYFIAQACAPCERKRGAHLLQHLTKYNSPPSGNVKMPSPPGRNNQRMALPERTLRMPVVSASAT
jgi:hypothetical protein